MENSLKQSIRCRVLFIDLLVSPAPLEGTTLLEGERSINRYSEVGIISLGFFVSLVCFKQADLPPHSKYFLVPLVSGQMKPGISFTYHVKMVLFSVGNCHEYQHTK